MTEKHVMYTDRPFPFHIFKVTHPLARVRLDHTDVAETHRQNMPAHMSEIRKERKAA